MVATPAAPCGSPRIIRAKDCFARTAQLASISLAAVASLILTAMPLATPATVAEAATMRPAASPIDLQSSIVPVLDPDKLRTSALPVVSVGDARCIEGSSCFFTFTLSGAPTGPTGAFVSFHTVDGTATSNGIVGQIDYRPLSNGISWGPGVQGTQTATVGVETFTDTAFLERDETFFMQIDGVGNCFPDPNRSRGTGIIVNRSITGPRS
jgi:hypothetical protein